MNAATPLLDVRRLRVDLRGEDGWITPVEDVSFSVAPGETLALVGESGSGKSLTALALLGLLPRGASRISADAIRLGDADLTRVTDAAWPTIRGRRAAIIFQEPMTALNPLMTIGEQVAEMLELHAGATRRPALAGALELLQRVGIGDAARRVRQYPHELSGGMRQRVMIAMALAGRPDLLIADEPTTALDVTIQGQILNLIAALQRETRMAMLLITHDLGVVARMAERIAVLYAGRIVEVGPTADLLAQPRHPYTRGLLDCVPKLARRGGRLPVIDGSVPGPDARPGGCRFHPRCERGRDDARCRTNEPTLDARPDGRAVACWMPESPA